MVRALWLAVLLAAAAAPLAAQDERWQVALDTDEYVWDIRLVRLDGDSLVVRQADTLRSIPVERITEIRRIRKTEVQLGDGRTAGTMNALTGTDDEVFDLTPLDFAARLRAVQQIFLRHPIRPDS